MWIVDDGDDVDRYNRGKLCLGVGRGGKRMAAALIKRLASSIPKSKNSHFTKLGSHCVSPRQMCARICVWAPLCSEALITYPCRCLRVDNDGVTDLPTCDLYVTATR